MPQKFDCARALSIAALGAFAFAYFRFRGCPAAGALHAAMAGCAALAVLWLMECLSGKEEGRAKKEKRADFDWGMHYLRGFAIICILLTHFFAWTGASKFSRAFLRSSTIFFLFISGYLCQYLASRRPLDTRKYYVSKLKNVIAPYVVCSLATMAAVLVIQSKTIGVIKPSQISLAAIPNTLLLGWAQRQYWYIPYVAVLFVFSPWLSRARDRTIVWLVAVSFLLAVCFPYRPPTHTKWIFSKFLYRYAYFTWGYLVGFLYARWKDPIDRHLREYLVPALFLGIAMGLNVLLPEGAAWKPAHILSGDLAYSLQKLFFLVPVLCAANRLRSVRISLFDMLATYSFTLFFLHYFFVGDYAVLQKWAFSAVGSGSVLRLGVRIGLATVFVFQNLLLAVSLKKACGRWSRSIIGS